MLSDSLCDACEEIWSAVQNYEYCEDYKDDIVDALTNLNFIVYKLDRMKDDCKLSKKDIRKNVLKRWSKRNCGESD